MDLSFGSWHLRRCVDMDGYGPPAREEISLILRLLRRRLIYVHCAVKSTLRQNVVNVI